MTALLRRGRLLDNLAALGELVASPAEQGGDQLVETLGILVDMVPGARWASFGERKRRVRPRTVASTGEPASMADAVQYQLGEGPTLQAIERRTPVVVSDATKDPRWPRFASSVESQLLIRSVLSVPLRGVRGNDASLNLYGDTTDAFDGPAIDVLPFAIAAADITLAGLRQRQRAHNLTRALLSNRRIGVGVGILMAQNHWTEDEAFAALGELSQALNRKVADLAEEVCLTGTLPSAPAGASGPGAALRPPDSASDGVAEREARRTGAAHSPASILPTRMPSPPSASRGAGTAACRESP